METRITPTPRAGCKLLNAIVEAPTMTKNGMIPVSYLLLEIPAEKSLLELAQVVGGKAVICANIVTQEGQRSEGYIPVERLLYAFAEPMVRLAVAADMPAPPQGVG